MGIRRDWSIIACVFLYVFLACQTHSNGLTQQTMKRRDLIKRMFGQPRRVNFRQYGGYVDLDGSADRFLYYYFVESSKANDSSPLVLWFNGGPLCSSLSSAFVSHGPFRVHSDGKTLYRNPYSWNKEANVLYIESPTQVGFSYTNSPSTEMYSKGDKITAEENYAFLVKWLERFPEYKSRQVFIATQSYGGHYAPQLAQLILERNNQTFINLQGILLGNPSLDDDSLNQGNSEYFVSHALVSTEIMAQKNRICEKVGAMDETCSSETKKVDDLTKDLNLYSIYAPVCLNSTLTRKPKKHTTVLKSDPCDSIYMTAYLNMAKVQKAMHANTTKLQYPWSRCADKLSLYWDLDEKSQSMLPTIQWIMKTGVRILVFSGDTDSVVSVTGTRYALKMMNLTVEKPWRPWFSQAEVGGYTEEYKGNLMFATVRGAGHTISTDQPKRALTLFTNFIRKTPLP